MNKGADAFRSIGEVAKLIGVAPHVLRYWETQFSLLRPMKRPDGRRYYRPDDVRLAAGLCEVLREDGLTIRGAKKLLAQDRGEAVRRRGNERLQQQPETPTPDSRTFDPAGNGVPAPMQPPAQPGTSPDDDMPSPNAKPRRRVRRPAPAQSDALPLFPDLKEAGSQADWLAQLVSTAVILRQLQRNDTRMPAARDLVSALSRSIGTLY
ncbi:MerR family transcriptional regulator [Paracoccus sp. Z330]|uniref:MerR family transcriptional regulator n=1 Tax=Paracoccus onchidii TaxID=3017813 RepID=A0ABT4ZAX6_9RHOB|nr:MerR family transcriptional regulator [Paracoccus onchidii]MDB6176515.1 MerR family transcriptional regulator [Paracoccus onchidii]